MTAEHLEYELRTADGVKLAGQAWMPPDPRAVVAVVHDVFLTLGIFFISGRQLSAPMVAAVPEPGIKCFKKIVTTNPAAIKKL